MKEANEILQELKEMDSPLAAMSREMPFSLPADYFGQLSDNLLTIAFDDSELPKYLKTQNPFTVPAGYFDSFAANMKAAAVATDVPAAVPVTAKPQTIALSFRQVKWAAAAILITFISFGGYMMFTGGNGSTEKMLSSIPRTDINEYMRHTYDLNTEKIINHQDLDIQNVDSKDIVQYLDETGWD